MLIGKRGMIGWELRRTLVSLGPVVALGRRDLDLADPDQIRRRVREVDPALIVNAAAYTAVDEAEAEPDQAMAVNGTAPGILAEEAKRLNVPLVHYSTDYVFDGANGAETPPRPYRESDRPEPLNVYGRTKLAGDEAIAAVAPAYLILRTSWVYAARGRNFFRTIQRLAADSEEIRVVDDQVGSPTWARTVAEATAQVLGRTWAGPEGPGSLTEAGGLYHLSAGRQTTWHGFAERIMSLARDRGEEDIRTERLLPISSQAWASAATRPAYSVLDCGLAERWFGISMPDWDIQLELCLDG